MSVRETPMAMLDRLLGRRDVAPDDPLARRIGDALAEIQPDPLFERRTRAATVNLHLAVAARGRTRSRRQMGRLGRAVLYASFALAISATAVGAAAQRALPGEALYLVKLRLEEIRIEIAPVGLRPQLVAAALGERLLEVEELADRGDWTGVAAALPMVDETSARLAAFGLGEGTPGAQALEHHVEVLAAIADRAPDAARPGLERAIAASAAGTGDPAQTPGDTHGAPAGGIQPTAPGGGGAPPPDHGAGQAGGERGQGKPGDGATPGTDPDPTPGPPGDHGPPAGDE